MIKVATVCSGIGSPEQALSNLGVEHEISFSCEIDKYARETYSANFKAKHTYTDMTKEEWNLPEQYADLFIGGIPCQAFSLAGKRLGELDPRGLLFFDFYRYVKNQQPKVFIIENVKGLLSDNKGKTFQNWLHLLGRSVNTQEQNFAHPDSLQYNLHYTVLNSKNFGVPQNRERVFIVGIRKDLPNDFSFPKGWALGKRLKDILEPEVDEKYYLSDKMVSGFMSKGDAGYINQDTQASQVHNLLGVMPTISAGTHGYANGYVNEPIFLNGKDICNTIRTGGKGSMTEKHSWDVIIEPRLILECTLSGSHEATSRVYSSCGLCPTITAKQGGGHEPKTKQHNRIRRLTPLECFRLQGFPDSYIKPCSDSQTYKQAGNSITVSVIQSIIKNLLNLF